MAPIVQWANLCGRLAATGGYMLTRLDRMEIWGWIVRFFTRNPDPRWRVILETGVVKVFTAHPECAVLFAEYRQIYNKVPLSSRIDYRTRTISLRVIPEDEPCIDPKCHHRLM